MLIELTEYNTWANRQITGFILQAGLEIADKELVSSFPTIRKTLYHIWDAQVIWYARLNGMPLTTWPSKSFNDSLEEACKQLIRHSEDFAAFAKEAEGTYSNIISYKTLDGKENSNTVSEIILHCMNHGTYHRGQLITMLRKAGFQEVGSTDLMRFYRQRL